MAYKIRYVNGHVEVFDESGLFVCSADTEQEARKEMEE
jgi:hypothetical protein